MGALRPGVCILRKSLKYCAESSGRYDLGGGFGGGCPSANASEDEDELIPGGGGVGYAIADVVC